MCSKHERRKRDDAHNKGPGSARELKRRNERRGHNLERGGEEEGGVAKRMEWMGRY
jgi:hypothetical protein